MRPAAAEAAEAAVDAFNTKFTELVNAEYGSSSFGEQLWTGEVEKLKAA
jgi:hypothetical protein